MHAPNYHTDDRYSLLTFSQQSPFLTQNELDYEEVGRIREFFSSGFGVKLVDTKYFALVYERGRVFKLTANQFKIDLTIVIDQLEESSGPTDFFICPIHGYGAWQVGNRLELQRILSTTQYAEGILLLIEEDFALAWSLRDVGAQLIVFQNLYRTHATTWYHPSPFSINNHGTSIPELLVHSSTVLQSLGKRLSKQNEKNH